MPTPRREGAPLQQISLVMPAFKGLNKQAETSVLGPEWATIATDAIFDTSGRIAARQGFNNITSTPMSGTPVVEQIFEMVRLDGTTQIISAAGGKLWRDTSVPTDITGSATVPANNWQFLNFAGVCIGVQQGATPIRYDGSTSFANLTVSDGGTIPVGNCGVVHSGRLWIAAGDKHTIAYSGLLNENHWASGASGAGTVDMTSVWPGGTDEITALAFFSGMMVVFGKNRIVLFGDGTGSVNGINPNNMFVTDTVVGTGCIARDSVQTIDGGDLLFLSAQGICSLSRLLVAKSNPIENISKNNRDYLNGLVQGGDRNKIRSVYSPENSFYLLSIPDIGVAMYFNTLTRLDDGTLRTTQWTLSPRSIVRRLTGEVYMGLTTGAGGKIGQYSGFQDNGVSYRFDYTSGWMDAGSDFSQYLKLLKEFIAIVWITASADVAIKWGLDFNSTFSTQAISLTSSGSSEWGIMEWGIDEWSGGVALRNISLPVSGSGQYFRLGAQATINGSAFAMQQVNLYAKIGRMAK